MLVALVTILIVALLSSVQTETKSTRSMMAGQNAKQLADLANQIVVSQIQQATTQGPTIAWASQPGMIRCYDNGGAEREWYKLYSATQMVQKAPSSGPLTAIQGDVPGDNCMVPGSASYGLYTDINSPVFSSSGTLTYPIVDPSGAKSIASAGQSVLGFDVQNASPDLTQAPGLCGRHGLAHEQSRGHARALALRAGRRHAGRRPARLRGGTGAGGRRKSDQQPDRRPRRLLDR